MNKPRLSHIKYVNILTVSILVLISRLYLYPSFVSNNYYTFFVFCLYLNVVFDRQCLAGSRLVLEIE